jgi:hypothetical protein
MTRKSYKTTPVFNEASLPRTMRQAHNSRPACHPARNPNERIGDRGRQSAGRAFQSDRGWAKRGLHGIRVTGRCSGSQRPTALPAAARGRAKVVDLSGDWS